VLVRELIARFGLDFDGAGFARADGAMNQLTNGAKKLFVALGGLAAARAGFEIAESAAQYEDAKRIFDATGESLDELREKSKGVLDDRTLVTQRNLARQFGITKDQFAEFIGISDAAAKTLGKSQKYIFESLITGSARASKPILDNAGILLDSEKLLSAAAKRLGKDQSALTDDERRQAIIGGVLEQGRKIKATVQGVDATVSDTYDRWSATFGNLKLALGGLVDVFVQRVAPAFETVAAIAQSGAKALTTYAKDTSKVTWLMRRLGEVIMFFVVRSIVLSGVQLAVYIGKLIASTTATLAATSATVLQAAANGYLAGSFGVVVYAIDMATVAARTFFLNLIAGPAFVGGTILAIVLMLAFFASEIYAVFTDTDGLFEKMSGHWGELRDRLMDGVEADEWWLVQALRLAAITAADLFDKLDQAFTTFFEANAANGTDWLDWLNAPLKTALDLIARVMIEGARLGRFGEGLKNFFSTGIAGQLYTDSEQTAPNPGNRYFGAARGADGPTFSPPPRASAGPTIQQTMSMEVDLSGQSLDPGAASDAVRRATQEAMTLANAEALRALTPSKAAP
jgi:hypothetical protein